MKTNVYHPTLSELTCPHLLSPVGRVTAIRWLDAEAMQLAHQTQQGAYMNPQAVMYPPNMPSLAVLAKAAADRHLFVRASSPEETVIMSNNRLGKAISIAVHRYDDALNRAGEQYLAATIKKELVQHKVSVQGYVGELWALHVLRVDPLAPGYVAFCYLTEKRLLNKAINGEADTIAVQLVSALNPSMNTPVSGM